MSVPGILIVLGSPNDEEGRLSRMARERLECARALRSLHPDHPILLTGGFGEHFNRSPRPHAEHARAYLLSKGVPEEAFLEFALSGNTLEDAALSRPIALSREPARLMVITSDFHRRRAKRVFDREYAPLSIRYVGAAHRCSGEERRRLEIHETGALQRLRGDAG